jgi:catechol 2,3-dioxygenase-like lactoylglutathione lyase family enzyme
MTTSTTQSLCLNGVHHSARPTWKLRETVEYYRDTLGLPLVHSVSARGWGAANHPDFLHFFFDSGNDSTIAFFYYIGTTQPEHLVHRPEYDSDATHTSWRVETKEQLQAWRARLEAKGVKILYQIEHEVVESIYFRDPNGYYLEIGRPLRNFVDLDASDAELTLQAAMKLEHQLKDVESVWRAKGEMLGIGETINKTTGVVIFVPDIAEFSAVIAAVRQAGHCEMLPPKNGYWRIQSERELQFQRKALGLGPALWNSMLSGGFRGRITEYSRDILRIEAEG